MEFKFREKYKNLEQYRQPLNYELVGKKLEILLDDFGTCWFDFKSEDRLDFEFGDFHQENEYEVMKSDNHVYLIHFEIEKAFPRKCISMVYDRDTEQVTLLHAQQGNEDGSSKAVTHKFYFGAAKKEDGTYPEGRAHYTEDLVGEAIDFTYTSDFTWRHTYLQPHLYRWQLASAGELGQSGVDKEGDWQNDYCDFIKINDHIYLFSWIEKIACTQGMCLENLDKMYHVGCFFGVGPDGGPENYTMSAYGKPAVYEETISR